MTNTIQQHLTGWIPYKLLPENEQVLFSWLYTGKQAYTDPFFDETIVKCRRYTQNTGKHRSSCTAAMLEEWSMQTDHVEPTAFIFHVSRCGSTLVSQALGMEPGHISLAEVPVFDDILRLGLKDPQYNETTTGKLLKAAIRFYGAKRTGVEQKLFIKTDSWHLLFYRQLRKLYPHTPFIILYRNPAEVLHSNHVRKGIQAVYGLIEPELLGLENINDEQTHPDVYMQLVLEKYYRAIIDIFNNDQQTLLLNYNQGLVGMMQEIAAFTGMPLSAGYMEAIADRGRYNAKYPKEKFAERNTESITDKAALETLEQQYGEIDKLRITRQYFASTGQTL